MARLFRREYHEHSNTWYFQSQVRHFKKDQLTIQRFKNEKENFILTFEPIEEVRSKLPGKVTIEFDLNKQKVRNYTCTACDETDCCRHFLSVVQYGYRFYSTEYLEQPIVQTYQGKMMIYNEFWQRRILNSRILVSDLYDNGSDKVRFHFVGYKDFDLRLISLSQTDKPWREADLEFAELIEKQKRVFSEEELQLLGLLSEKKCSFSSKSNFFTIYKRDIFTFFPTLKSLKKIFIKETGDQLLFSEDKYSLTFQINLFRPNEYKISLNDPHSISAVFCGKTTYLLKKNVVYALNLPFDSEILESIVKNDYIVNEEDLIYLQAVVSRQLALVNCYLDFDEDIVHPEVYDNDPIVTFNIEKDGDSIVMQGLLDYSKNDEEIVIPMSVIRFSTELVRFDDNELQTWYYIPPQIRYQILSFMEQLPEAQTHLLDQSSKLVFTGENNIDLLKKTIFEHTAPEWNIELSDELKKEFVYKVVLKPQIEARESDLIDWFDYEVKYYYKDLAFTHDELKKFFTTKEKFLKLDDGRLLFFENKEAFEEVEHFITKSDSEKEEIYSMSVKNIPFLFQLPAINNGIKILGDSFLDEMYEDILRRKLVTKEIVPSNLRPIMRSYQKNGFQWMKMLEKYRFGGILADDMGLGKTLQAISILSSKNSDKPSIVVCPKTLLFNWAAEIEKFSPQLSYILLEGSKEERTKLLENINVDVIIVGYSIIPNDLDLLKKLKFSYVFLDEAQHIKNSNAIRTKAIKALNADHRIALTGTPMENNPTEVWSIFDFLMPNYLPELSKFKREYVARLAEDRAVRNRLASLLSPFILRRKKEEVLIELPDKQEQIIFCKMTEFQEKTYMQIIDSFKKTLLNKLEKDGPGNHYMHVLSALMRLRQICNHPSLANSEISDEPDISGKVALLRELITDAVSSGRKLLIFSQFVGMLKVVKKMLIEEDIVYEYLDGSTKNRQKHIENFNNNNNVRAFLISLKAGGFGLNLTAADTVIIVDPWRNPMGERQAIDRAYRLGQTKKVLVYKLLTKGTVEEKIASLQRNKEEMFEHIIEGSQHVLKNLELDEIRELFDYKS